MATVSEAGTPSAVTDILSSQNPSNSTVSSTDESKKKLPEFHWMVKPCHVYKDEHKDCKSFKARFHQYFLDGKTQDCSHWKDGYDNCRSWEKNGDTEALKKVIDYEKSRIKHRLRTHYANDVWENRTSPPPDWNKPLPKSIQKSYEGSVLQLKANALKTGEEKLEPLPDGDPNNLETSYCSIM